MNINILLPSDFSDNAWSAIVYALKLYANETCTFYFLNTIKNEELAERTLVTSHFIEELKIKYKKKLQDLKEQAERTNTNENHNFKVVLSEDKLPKAIADCIDSHAINMVVMGTKGASKRNTLFFGSNTVAVLNNIHACPILVVPDEYDFVVPSQIAFPTDYNRFYKDNELQILGKLTKLYDSKIRVVHIEEEKELSEVQQYNISQLDTYLQSYSHSFHWMPNYAEKTTVINDFIEELDINILVVVNYKHSFVESIIKEPVIKKIGFHPLIPFLVIPE